MKKNTDNNTDLKNLNNNEIKTKKNKKILNIEIKARTKREMIVSFLFITIFINTIAILIVNSAFAIPPKQNTADLIKIKILHNVKINKTKLIHSFKGIQLKAIKSKQNTITINCSILQRNKNNCNLNYVRLFWWENKNPDILIEKRLKIDKIILNKGWVFKIPLLLNITDAFISEEQNFSNYNNNTNELILFNPHKKTTNRYIKKIELNDPISNTNKTIYKNTNKIPLILYYHLNSLNQIIITYNDQTKQLFINNKIPQKPEIEFSVKKTDNIFLDGIKVIVNITNNQNPNNFKLKITCDSKNIKCSEINDEWNLFSFEKHIKTYFLFPKIINKPHEIKAITLIDSILAFELKDAIINYKNAKQLKIKVIITSNNQTSIKEKEINAMSIYFKPIKIYNYILVGLLITTVLLIIDSLFRNAHKKSYNTINQKNSLKKTRKTQK